MLNKLTYIKETRGNLQSNTIQLNKMLEEGTKELPTIPKKEKEEALSTQTRQILQQRKNASSKPNIKAYNQLDKRFRKSKKEDKTNMIIKTLDKDLDVRDRWLGIRQLKQQYQPNPYARTNSAGMHITQRQRAQQAANYLSGEQWGKKKKLENEDEETSRAPKITRKIHSTKNTERQYKIDEITVEEIWSTLKKYKRRTSPGPDEIPMELFKEMDNDCLQEIADLLNQWWNEEDIPEETLRARVVLIYKKGDAGTYENYRPISLLNANYKIYAGIIQKRSAVTSDKHLSKTLFGFSQDKSTADAIQIIRRVAEHGQGTKNKLHMVPLDWEKAFDKVDRDKLFEAMERMSVHPKRINVIKSLYKNTQFKVEIDGD